ncbi:MAG TPA: glycoside hydrolase family 88 protein, partial [Hymenobacter sp.]|uniref:glycoside hydrolase family 88 protein n=1 Tax=Hymenobacter sp. TaxID=1898978 RepID=UPI002ED9A46F
MWLLLSGLVAQAQSAGKPKPLWQQMADSFMRQYPDSLGLEKNKVARWGYKQGLMLKALERVGERAGDPRYMDYIVRTIDYSIAPDGTIARYNFDDFNLDNINTGRILLMLMQQPNLPAPRREAYRKAAQRLHQQLDEQPRTKEGGYWHKKRYTHQMWLDGLYMAEPFYAEYSKLFNQPAGFDDVAKQFALIEKNL